MITRKPKKRCGGSGRWIAILSISLAVTSCATSTDGRFGRGDVGAIREAMANAGVVEISLPGGPDGEGRPVLEGEVLGFEAKVRLPSGWRVSRALEEGAGMYDFVDGDGRIRGVMALLDDSKPAVEIGAELIAAAADRPGTNGWVADINRDLEVGIVRPLGDQRHEVTVIVEQNRGVAVIVAAVSNPMPADYANLASAVAGLQPHINDQRMSRTFAVGPVGYSVRLRDYEWISDVTSQGGVFLHIDSGLPVVVTREDPRRSAGFGDLEFLPPDPSVTTSNYIGPHRFLSNPRLTHAADAVSWTGARYHISRTRGEEVVWFIIPEEIGSLGLSNFTLEPMVLNMVNTDVGMEEEDTGTSEILRVDAPDRRGVVILPVITTVDGAVAGQIERMVAETVNSAVRLSSDQPIIDASTLSLGTLPETIEEARDHLARVSEQTSAQWIAGVEISQVDDSDLPSVRVIIYNSRAGDGTEGITEIRSQLASLFDVFPLVDEVSAQTVGTITDTDVAFGSLTIEVPVWATGVDVTIDGRLMPRGQLIFERFPTGTYQVSVTQQRGGRPIRFVDDEFSVGTGTAVTIEAPIPRLTDQERNELESAAPGTTLASETFFRRIAELPIDASERRAIVDEFGLGNRLSEEIRADIAVYEFSLLGGVGRQQAVQERFTELVGIATGD